jgi:hypothetical protein
MKITIAQQHDLNTRTITVHVEADSGKRLKHVKTEYDNFTLGDDSIQPLASMYESTFLKQEGLDPIRQHLVIVSVLDSDNNSDSAQKRWRDTLG